MFVVTFKDQDVRNLAAFLERINLKGSEVEAFNSIVNALNAAKKEEAKEVKTPEQPPTDTQ